LVCAVALTSYAGTTSYTYDVHGRLVAIAVPNGSQQSITTNSYDNAGNRQSVVVIVSETTPPNTPTNLTATAQALDLIRLNWTTSLDVGGGPVSYYRVYRGGTHIASPNVPPFDDWPLTQGTTYSYTVAAVDPSGNVSTQSSPASATTLSETTPPSVPTNLQGVAVSGTQVNLSWGASTDTGGSGLAGYEIFRNNGASPLGTSSVASYSDTTAVNGTTYSYQVRAYDGAGNRSSLSNQINVSTPDTLPPSAPGAPSFSGITAHEAIASWGAATDNVAVWGYQHRVNGGVWQGIGSYLSVSLVGLSASTTYTVEVRARDAAGNWGATSSGQFTTPPLAWITISYNGVDVLPEHQSVYSCGEDFDWSIPYYNNWCSVGAELVYDHWINAGGESWVHAEGYRNELEVREDRYGQP
jgi:YD repeat-containing protein